MQKSLIKILATACLLTIYSHCGLISYAQDKAAKIYGSVKDSNGESLIGVFVSYKGSKTGETSDLDGNYSISFSQETGRKILTFQYLGMKTLEVEVEKPGPLNVTLESDSELEAAVINAGYGLIQNKENFTGSAFQVSRDKISMKPAARIDNILAGQVPGLNVIEDNSNGRTSVKIRIRGDGSLSASNEPLWVIDGVPIYTGGRTGTISGTSANVSPLSYINPDDIESMTVLKDASTTALYGADGANGVILVTTRSAKKGITSYNASIKYGISNIDRSTTKKLLNGTQYLMLAKEAWVNAGRPADAFPYRDNERNSYSTTNTDWFGVYTGTGSDTEINFSASGGSESMENYFSLSYYAQKTPFIGNSSQRYSLRDKVTLKFSKKFSATVNLSGTYTKNNIFSLPSSFEKILPIFSPYNEDGSYRLYNYYSRSETVYKEEAIKFLSNKLPEREYNDNYQHSVAANTDVTFEWKPIEGLTITSLTGANFLNIYSATYRSMKTRSGLSDAGLNGYSERFGMFDTVLLENLRANYKRDFLDGKLSTNFMLGTEYTSNYHPSLNASGNGFANDKTKEIAYADASTRKGSSSLSNNKSLSYIAYASATYDRRYGITLSTRRQGSSSFNQYARWGQFSSIGLTWNIHREAFWNVEAMDIFKIKASYGNNGNSRIDTSSSYGSYSSNAYYGGKAGTKLSSPANPGLSWENTHILNVGVVLGFLRRFSLDVQFYNKRTSDILYSGRVSSIISDSSVMSNVGEITNKGIEFEFNASIIHGRDFNWSASVNGSRNRNTITKLYKGMHTGFFDHVWIEGAPKDAWWLVRWAGVDPTSGAPMWYDKEGNLTYSFSYANRVLLPQYSKQPDLYGGVSNDFSYKQWSMRVMFDYTIGGWDQIDPFDYGSSALEENIAVEMLDHWRKPGDLNEHPAFIAKRGDMAGFNSTKHLYNMSGIQFRSVSLAYRMPEKINKKLGVKSAVVSLLANNLYLWTPAQSPSLNSYKTLKYKNGMTRTISAQISLNF